MGSTQRYNLGAPGEGRTGAGPPKRPDSPQWLEAKASGDEAQELLAGWFMQRGFEAYQTIGRANTDLLVQCRIEVKHDLQAPRTGNVAIEVSCSGRPSGISTSSADFWAIVIGNEAYIVDTTRLRQFVSSNEFREVAAGDRKAARVRLLPLDRLRSIPGVRRAALVVFRG